MGFRSWYGLIQSFPRAMDEAWLRPFIGLMMNLNLLAEVWRLQLHAPPQSATRILLSLSTTERTLGRGV